MCGKFTAQASWSEVVDFSQPLTESGGGESGDEGGNDKIVTYRVGGLLPVTAGRRPLATTRRVVYPRLLIKSRRRATSKRYIALWTTARTGRAR
jgi:hypothetical protein